MPAEFFHEAHHRLARLPTLCRHVAQGVLRVLLPNHCGLCGAPCVSATEVSAANTRWICATCIQTHCGAQGHAYSRCVCCGLKLPDAHTHEADRREPQCGRCLRTPPHFDRTYVAVDYHAPWEGAIHALKFGGQLTYAHLLAGMWQRQFSTLPPLDYLFAAPLSQQRLRERGFNQALEIARPLAQHYQLPLDTAHLVKVRDTPQQTTLSRQERLRHLRGAFSCTRRLDGLHVAVLDDVMTTGATLNEIATTLKHVGALSVTNWVIARTPKERTG